MRVEFLRSTGSGVGKIKIGKGSKVMVVADGNGLPIGLYVASAHPSEHTLAAPTLAMVKVPQPRGRPRIRPQELVADKGYDSQALRQWLRRQGIKPTIPVIERHRRRPKRGRPLRTGASYRCHWKVERCFA
jgi:Transposase DDE domain